MNKTETDCQVQSGGTSTFLKGALVGGLLGAAAALLFAPKSGRELRGDLSGTISTMTDKSKELASTLGEKASDVAKSVSSKTAELAKSVNEGKNSIMESVKQASADLAEDAKNASDKVKAAAEDASQTAAGKME